jgi:hypothetical protein
MVVKLHQPVFRPLFVASVLDVSYLLYPFWRKMPFRCWISPQRLSVSHSVLARQTNVVSTARFCAG